jgi:hypothetical protein
MEFADGGDLAVIDILFRILLVKNDKKAKNFMKISSGRSHMIF